jgi:RNA polymerase sigma factor (sigma-70 family)
MSDPENHDDDPAIIRRVLAGKRDDFRFLVLRHQNFVFSLLMRQLRDHSRAEDLAQETFTRAYANLSSFRFESAFTTWLARIALNQLNTYLQSRSFRESRRTEGLEREEVSNMPLVNQPAVSNELVDALRVALGELSPKFREVLVLCALEGRSYEEAASAIGIPIGTVRSRLNIARGKLRKLLDPLLSKDIQL